MSGRKDNTHTSLKILLTNGRFPVTLDLARQLELAGHHVYVVDPMHYHVCKFSTAVRKSYYVPAPHADSAGYIRGVLHAIDDADIDLVLPLHEEIFYLTQTDEPEIQKRLFAPPFEVLILLHNKWEFSQWLGEGGLDTPKALLCRNMDDVRKLDSNKEYALKPVFGRSASKVHHLKPDKPLPEDCDVDEENHYIAQEWTYGERFCTYSIIIQGRMRILVMYPVQDTIDGSSCVYFKAIEHRQIETYIKRLVARLGNVTGQLAFDFIETAEGRLVAMECNPRATSGIHLFSRTPDLAYFFGEVDPSAPSLVAHTGIKKQVAPAMLMVPVNSHSNLKQYFKHMARLISTKDVMFDKKDLGPTLMQPFLLTSYYKICQEKGGMKLKDMFQWDLTWEPQGEELRRVRELMERSSRERQDEKNR
jgi:glutathione synthase/RimK-type ligase-like ATP-grasp enzyme